MYGMVTRAFKNVKRACPTPVFRRRSNGRKAPAVDIEARVDVLPRRTRRRRHEGEHARRKVIEATIVGVALFALAAAVLIVGI